MSITIKDVAKETNLAMSTISKYMNGGNVRPKNREIIEEAVKRLGYHPNDIARGLRSTKTRTVGIVVSSFDTHMVQILNGIEKTLRANGYFPIICSHRDSLEKANQAIHFLMEKRVDGIIVEGILTSQKYVLPILDREIPLLGLETITDNLAMDYVVADGATGSYQAVEELVKRGHTKVGIISGPEGYYTARERLRGYLRVFEDYEIEVKKEYIIEGDYTYQSGYEGICRLWKLEQPPTAVFICNYNMCLGAVAAINQLGIHMPAELSLVTFDDMEFSRIVRPHLSSFRQPLEKMGIQAAQILVKRMNGDYGDFPKKVRLKGEFISRDSVRCV
ncbi:MAG: LacI family DNA-binding transcriptional regulator [Lachnospiraceae bacterium]|nr:LacI family DNA-binding transcriptional regulator [Lachnospiraceae bacterium]MDD3614745.1 LacI family DNA-binding transcriptional regulator [Lachnospiraceae bacterium]